jgi:ribulose-phosphate 3-epimerase
MLRLSPSLAAAPLAHLAQTLRELEQGGADLLHVDLEDGHFIPSLALGTRLLEEARPLTRLPLDVHLLVAEPDWLIDEAARLGAAILTVHLEACRDPAAVLGRTRDLGMQAGLALNARTPLLDLRPLLHLLDVVNVQSTEPRPPEWPFVPEALDKVAALAALAARHRPGLTICVDGGLNAGNIADAAAAGADLLVVGRSVFQDDTIAANLQQLREAALVGMGRRSR